MKINALFFYDDPNDLDFNQVIYQQFRGSIWFNETTFTSFQIEEINNSSAIILPSTTEVVILNILDSSVASLIRAGDILNWGVPYKKVGDIKVVDIIVPCEKSFFGTKK